MKALAILTMVFLPATFVAVSFPPSFLSPKLQSSRTYPQG